MNRLAVKIRDARLKAKLTEKQLAKKCGLTASYIIQIESGKKIVKEDLADKILKAMGEKAVTIIPENAREEEPEKPKAKQKSAPQPSYNVQPNAQWSDALAGVIKKFPVYDGISNKVVSYKELPILSKKIEGHHPDKIMFVQSPNDDMEALRIRKNDVITVFMTSEIQNDNIYLFEMNSKKMIRKLRKDSNNKVTLSKGIKGETPVVTELKKIKVIGKCLKVEFSIGK